MPLFRKRLAQNQDGATAVEFAMVAPVLTLIMSGIIEISLMMYASAVLEGATGISSRLGKTGYTVAGVSRQTMIYNLIKSQCGLLLDMTQVSINSLAYGNFNNIAQPEAFTDTNANGRWDIGEPYTDTNGNGQWDADMGATGVGNAGDVVLYKVTYPWPIQTPLMKYAFGGATYTITSSAVVKNEPYSASR